MQAWPRLVTSLPPLTRLDGSVQFGLDPGTGIRLAGLTEAEVTWVRGLDGGHDPLQKAQRQGLDQTRLQTILGVLREANLLAESPGVAMRSRREQPGRSERAAAARVWVQGSGLASARLADLLRHEGLGQIARFSALADTRLERRPPDLVILVAALPVSGADARHWRERRIPHLPVVVTARSATVGPLVGADGAPCLRCVELRRAARDPSWDTVAAQAQVHAGPETRPADDGLGAIAAGLAATIARAFLDGHPVTGGLALDVSSPWPAVRQHRWAAHPACAACGGNP